MRVSFVSIADDVNQLLGSEIVFHYMISFDSGFIEILSCCIYKSNLRFKSYMQLKVPLSKGSLD